MKNETSLSLSVFYIFPLLFVTFGAVTIFNQAFVKSISTVFVVRFLEGKHFVMGGMWQFGLEGSWVLIGLDSSVKENFTSNAEVPGSNSRSSHTFSFVFLSIFDMFISLNVSISPISRTYFLILVQILTIFGINTRTCK